jgi:hypothetical protein
MSSNLLGEIGSVAVGGLMARSIFATSTRWEQVLVMLAGGGAAYAGFQLMFGDESGDGNGAGKEIFERGISFMQKHPFLFITTWSVFSIGFTIVINWFLLPELEFVDALVPLFDITKMGAIAGLAGLVAAIYESNLLGFPVDVANYYLGLNNQTQLPTNPETVDPQDPNIPAGASSTRESYQKDKNGVVLLDKDGNPLPAYGISYVPADLFSFFAAFPMSIYHAVQSILKADSEQESSALSLPTLMTIIYIPFDTACMQWWRLTDLFIDLVMIGDFFVDIAGIVKGEIAEAEGALVADVKKAEGWFAHKFKDIWHLL